MKLCGCYIYKSLTGWRGWVLDNYVKVVINLLNFSANQTLMNTAKNNSLKELEIIMEGIFHYIKWLSISIKYFCWTNVIGLDQLY